MIGFQTRFRVNQFEVLMALPTAVATQLKELNIAVTNLLNDRERINDLFDTELGASTWSLLSATNQTIVKTALITHMQTSITDLNSVIAALQLL